MYFSWYYLRDCFLWNSLYSCLSFFLVLIMVSETLVFISFREFCPSSIYMAFLSFKFFGLIFRRVMYPASRVDLSYLFTTVAKFLDQIISKSSDNRKTSDLKLELEWEFKELHMDIDENNISYNEYDSYMLT